MKHSFWVISATWSIITVIARLFPQNLESLGSIVWLDPVSATRSIIVELVFFALLDLGA
jgi:hypothetical protein